MIRATLVASAVVLMLTSGSGAQSTPPAPYAAAPVPFGLGERMTYKVALGIVGEVGTGTLQVDTALDTIHGHPSYKLRFQLNGGVPFARVDDDYRSWLDVQSLISRRFKQDQHEVRYERHRTFDFLPEQRIWKRVDKNESGPMPTELPLDDVSFLYFIRTLPLEVGRTYSFNRYFHAEGNPVTVKVLRKETITVPAGRFQTIVVQPIIKTKGLFSEGGQAEVYFSDDNRRILVAIHSKVKILKSMDVRLESYSAGLRLASPAQ